MKRLLRKIQCLLTRTTYLNELLFKPDYRGDLVFLSLPDSEDDEKIANRIWRAFEKTQSHVKENRGDLWDGLSKHHTGLYTLKPEERVDYLRSINKQSITVGMCSGGTSEATLLIKSKRLQKEYVAFVNDRMKALEVAMGCPVSPIEPPLIGKDVFKVKIGDGYFDAGDPLALYTAWLLSKYKKVAEIGAGMGQVAFYAHRAGIDYSIFDLPTSNIAQAWYLIKSGVPVVLYGEKGEGVRILPFWEFTSKTKYDVTVNVDSFPEIDKEIVLTYLDTIKKNSRYFLSINQEKETPYGEGKVHSVVPRLVTGMERVYRYPSWLHRGYVEELYKI